MPVDQIPTETGRNPAMVRSWSDLDKMVEIRPDLTGSGHWSGWVWPKWPGFGQIWLDPEESGKNPAILARSGQTCSRNPATAAERCRIPMIVAFSPFGIFSCVPNAEKYFRENYFFWKWFRKKYFTTKTILHQNKRSIHFLHEEMIGWEINKRRQFMDMVHNVNKWEMLEIR